MICQRLRSIAALTAMVACMSLFVACVATGTAGSTLSPSATAQPTETPFATPTQPPQQRIGTDDLPAAQAKWNAAGISSYKYVIELGCFCLPETTQPFTITVRDDATQSIVDEAGHVVGPSHSAYQFLSNLATVDALFAKASAAAVSDYYIVELEFDATYGFPTRMYTNPAAFIADEELSVSVSGFVVLPQVTPVPTPVPTPVVTPAVLPNTGGRP